MGGDDAQFSKRKLINRINKYNNHFKPETKIKHKKKSHFVHIHKSTILQTFLIKNLNFFLNYMFLER